MTALPWLWMVMPSEHSITLHEFNFKEAAIHSKKAHVNDQEIQTSTG
jgi:hypothetical protein